MVLLVLLQICHRLPTRRENCCTTFCVRRRRRVVASSFVGGLKSDVDVRLSVHLVGVVFGIGGVLIKVWVMLLPGLFHCKEVRY